MNYLSLTLDYTLWWYSGGLKKLVLWMGALFGWVFNFFSVKRILGTLFAPWKRLVGVRRPGLDGMVDWILDNLISRLVGFILRLLILITFLVSLIALFIFCVIFLLVWIFFPFLFILAIYKAVQ